MVPSQKASTSSMPTPAELRASVVESTRSSSVPLSQCSPNGVQPIPTIATRSRIPLDAIASRSLLDGRRLRAGLPEIVVHVAGGERAPERHLHSISHLHLRGVGVGQLALQPPSPSKPTTTTITGADSEKASRSTV